MGILARFTPWVVLSMGLASMPPVVDYEQEDVVASIDDIACVAVAGDRVGSGQGVDRPSKVAETT